MTGASDDNRWRRFCVVGMGGHARTKLIPAIAANGQALAGLVSRQPAADLPPAPVFPRLEDALDTLPADVAFVLASPPAAHAGQAALIVAAQRDILVEKPAFVTAAEARAVVAQVKGTIFAEAFMHRHTALNAWWLTQWAEHRDQLVALDATFVVPALPAATFRAGDAIGASSLYDIGCYIVALLGDLGLDHAGLAVTQVAHAGALTECVTIAGLLDGIAVSATIGVAPEYANRATITLRNGDSISAAPFFYGRPGERHIDLVVDGVSESRTLAEEDAFRAMLSRPRGDWLADQPDRLVRLDAATETLERLGGELAAWRALGPDLQSGANLLPVAPVQRRPS